MRKGTNTLLGGLAAGAGLAVVAAVCLAGLKSGLAQMSANNASVAFEGAVVTALSSAGIAVSAWAALTLLLSLGTWLFPQAIGLARLLEDVGFPWLRRLGRQATVSAAAGGLGFALAFSPGLAIATSAHSASAAAAVGARLDTSQVVPALGSSQWEQAALPESVFFNTDHSAATPAQPGPIPADPAGGGGSNPSTTPSSTTNIPLPSWLEPDAARAPQDTVWPVRVPPLTEGHRSALPAWLEQATTESATTAQTTTEPTTTAHATTEPTTTAHATTERAVAASFGERETPATEAGQVSQGAHSEQESALPSLNWPAPSGPPVLVQGTGRPTDSPGTVTPTVPPQAGALPLPQLFQSRQPVTEVLAPGSSRRTAVATHPKVTPSTPPIAVPSPALRAGATVTPGHAVALEQPAHFHLVSPGESLWSICATLLPGATATQIDHVWREMYELNRAVIGSDPNLILPGQLLAIPDGVLS